MCLEGLERLFVVDSTLCSKDFVGGVNFKEFNLGSVRVREVIPSWRIIG